MTTATVQEIQEAKEFLTKELGETRTILIEERNTLDKGTPEGYKRYNEIEEELNKIRNVFAQF